MGCAQVLPEKEARLISAQVVQGLAYLNQAPRAIIHYDLKPANILFDGLGNAKITASPRCSLCTLPLLKHAPVRGLCDCPTRVSLYSVCTASYVPEGSTIPC